MPDSSGLATFTSLQARASHIPVIVLTGLDDERLAIQTVREGAQDYLVKTEVRVETLLHAIRYAIERKRLQEALAPHHRGIAHQECRDGSRSLHGPGAATGPAVAAKAHLSRRHGGRLHFHYRYQPTTVLAGDFFDVIAISDTTAGVLIADVMGHGVRAALVTALVRGLVEELTFAASDPAKFLTEINRGLTTILRNTDWPIPVSAFYLVADIATGRMRYANAAHPNPICLHRGSGITELVSRSANSSPGPILGILEDAVYSTSECQISPLDLVMLYTDGLYEAENLDAESFGHERLMASASTRIRQPAPLLFDGLLADVQQFTGSTEFADDICLVGIEIMRVGQSNSGP